MDKSEILKKIGKRIKEVRLQKGISQADLVGKMDGNIDPFINAYLSMDAEAQKGKKAE